MIVPQELWREPVNFEQVLTAQRDSWRNICRIEQRIGQLDQEMASLLRQHQDAVQRLAEVPGLVVDSAQQIIAEVGAKAATFASAKNLSSWWGHARERKRARK